MKIIETELPGCYIFEPKLYEDNRGYFFESYNESLFNRLIGKEVKFVQDNQSYSKRGVLRGLHAQSGIHSQAKLVTVLDGSVFDIVVDTRPNSPTFSKYICVELSSNNKRQLFIPRGFLHGFITVSEFALFFYKCDNYYKKESEIGVRFDDPTLKINWQLNKNEILVSDKDLMLPLFNEYCNIIVQ